MLRDRCPVRPVCLSVTLIYCGQTVRWIKMPLGTEVGRYMGEWRWRYVEQGGTHTFPMYSPGRHSFMAALCNTPCHIYFHPVVCSFFMIALCN